MNAANKSLAERSPEEIKTYDTFRDEFNNTINKVNALSPDIRAQWGSQLTMAYHWKKHINEFENEKLIKNYENNLSGYIRDELLKDVSHERQQNFTNKLNEINNLTADQQTNATEQLIKEIKLEKYFVEYAQLIFQNGNTVGSSHTQSGISKTSFARSFGARSHIGFTIGTDNNTRIATHFTKDQF
jgi:hypothetical protein